MFELAQAGPPTGLVSSQWEKHLLVLTGGMDPAWPQGLFRSLAEGVFEVWGFHTVGGGKG